MLMVISLILYDLYAYCFHTCEWGSRAEVTAFLRVSRIKYVMS